MARRLVLGCGSIGHAVVVALSGRRGDLSVIDPDADRVETLRNEGVPAHRGDPTDQDDLPSDDVPTTVFVAGDDPAANLAAAETARETYPGASLVVYAGDEVDPPARDAIEAIADRTVDRGGTVVDHVLGVVESEEGARLQELGTTLRGISGRLGVFTHDNPDPDAIASAIALADLAESVGTEAEACYFGDISHQENRALVNVLELDLNNLDAEEFDLDDYGGIALVDHSRPGVNDQLPEGIEPDVVIDHHPPRGPIVGRFVDLRSDVGATSTLLSDYYRTIGTEIDETVATALLYGIRVDTRNFGREITPADFDAAAYLLEFADVDALRRIESPSVTGEMLSVLARAITNREVREAVLATAIGWTADRDALAQAADTLVTMDGVTTVLVLGLLEETDTVIASARTRGAAVDIGETLRLAYGQIGSAGGHSDMAGAQIPLGILGAVEDETGSLEEVIGDVLVDRFFEVLADEGEIEPADDFLRGGLPPSTLAGEENDFSPRDPSA